MTDAENADDTTGSIDHVPPTLADRDRWMVWNYDDETKIPRAPWDRPIKYGADTQDPSLWVSLEDAQEAADRDDVDGIAYVIPNRDPEHDHADALPEPDHVLVDFDNVRDPETGDHHPIMDRIFDGLETYGQISTSGTGYHIIGRGELPDGTRSIEKDLAEMGEFDAGSVEVYDSGRYIAFTGNHVDGTLGDTGDIQPLVDDIAAATESDSPEKATRTPEKSEADISDIDTTRDIEDVFDAINYVSPGDIRLNSDVTEERANGDVDLDPAWADSKSGRRLAQLNDGWVYRKGMVSLDALQVVALEEGIITDETEYPSGRDFWDAVDALRDRGAHIPELSTGDLPDDAVERRGSLTDADKWEIFAESRANGTMNSSDVIPAGALRHIAREHDYYDFEALPEDVDALPAKAHNRALWWVEEQWPEEAGILIGEDEDVTARNYKARDVEAVYTWEDVRYIYDDDTDHGRRAAVNYLRSKYEFLTVEETDTLHVYDPELGIYDDTLSIGRELDLNLHEHYDQTEKREILGRLKEQTVPERELNAFEFDGEYVCVENGVLDVWDGVLMGHDPGFKFTSHIPVEYDPDAVPENILRFLRDITDRDADVRTLLEFAGHTLISDYDDGWKQMFLILFGEGSNGKSTWFDVVRTFLNGKRQTRNVESMTLQQIADNRFAASSLVGAWANIGEDLPQKRLTNVGKLKDLTGGGETWVEQKGVEGFNFYNRATMMFGANRPPVIGERTIALKRRLVPVHLPYQYKENPDPDDPFEKQVDKGLLDRLTTDAELSGLLNAALTALWRLEENGDVSIPEGLDERLELYERFSDHIKAFRIDCLTDDAEEYEYVEKDDVYNAYTNYCNERDFSQVANSVFWKELRQTTLTVSERQLSPQEDGSRPRVLDGVAFKPKGEEYAPSETSHDPAPPEENKERVRSAIDALYGSGDAVQTSDIAPITGVDEMDVFESVKSIANDKAEPHLTSDGDGGYEVV